MGKVEIRKKDGCCIAEKTDSGVKVCVGEVWDEGVYGDVMRKCTIVLSDIEWECLKREVEKAVCV